MVFIKTPTILIPFKLGDSEMFLRHIFWITGLNKSILNTDFHHES